MRPWFQSQHEGGKHAGRKEKKKKINKKNKMKVSINSTE
jgi:hypothetical protein